MLGTVAHTCNPSYSGGSQSKVCPKQKCKTLPQNKLKEKGVEA
jgi:hypothetical protein